MTAAARGHECYHCRQWVPAGEAHDCWTTTEEALTGDLPEELREAWERLRDTAAEFGEQRIYASHSSIMFSRNACYFFVRPRLSRLEIVAFLGRTLKAPQVRKTVATSRTKVAHVFHVVHRDQVEPPLTDWLKEAYDVSPSLSARGGRKSAAKTARKSGVRKTRTPRRTAIRNRKLR